MNYLTTGDHKSSQLSASEKPLPQSLERQFTFTIPAGIPLPKFAFNQRLRCNSGYYSDFTGIVRGVEYLDHKAALAQGFGSDEDAEVWSYVLRLDDDDPQWRQYPVFVCKEDRLELLEHPLEAAMANTPQ